MIRWLSDPAWVGVIVAVATMIVSIAIYLKKKTKKAFTYEIGTQSLLDVHDHVKARLRVMLDNKEVEGAHQHQIRFRNDGNVPIIPDDFKYPLSIIFESPASILDMQIVAKKPPDLSITRIEDPQTALTQVTFEPTLLNRGNEFTLKLFVINGLREPNIRVRIVGCDPSRRTKHGRGYTSTVFAYLNILTFLVFFVMISNLIPEINEIYLMIAVLITLVGLAAIMDS